MIKRVAALLFVLAAGACSSTPSPEAGEVRVIPLGGLVSLLDGGETTLLEEETTVQSGVSIITEAGGRAQIELPGQRSMELAPETKLLVDDGFSELSGGSILVRTGSPMMLRAGGAEIEAAEGVFRIDRDLSSVLLATYTGAATVLGSGVPPVTALRQADVLQGGEIPLGVQALDVRPNDLWDAELLGRSIDLGLRLLDYERGLERQLPSNRQVEAVSQVLEQRFSTRAIKSAIGQLGNAARAVVAAVVAQEAAHLNGSSATSVLSEIVNRIQSLRANWIVIVAEWGLPAAAAALTQQLRDFADSIVQVVTPPAAAGLSTSGSSGTVGPRDNGPSGTGGPSDGGGPNPPGGGGPDKETQTPPDPPPIEDGSGDVAPPPPCGSTVECTVEEILEPPGAPRDDSPVI